MVIATIEDLRKFQWGKESAAAQVNLTVDVQVTANDTMTIGTTVYTFVAAAPTAGQILIGGNLAATQANIIAAINGTDSINSPHVSVIAYVFVANVAIIRARVSGTEGNSIATTETFTAGTNIFSAATLLGGTSKGTAVPATSIMLVANWDAEPTDQVYHPPLLRGLIQRWKGGEIVIERGTRFTIPETPAFYEQMPNWCSMSVARYQAPTGAGPYTYLFTRDPTTNPDVDTWTIQRRLSDGVNNIDQRAVYSMMSRIMWSGAQNQPVMLSGEGFGRRLVNSPITASLSAPVAEALLASSSKVYIDSTWANVGTTQIQAQILGWEIGFTTGYAPLFTTDGRPDLDFTVAALSSDNTQLAVTIRMLVKAAAGGQFAIEQAAAEAQTLRAIRVECTGSSNRRVRFDMLLKHNLGSLFQVGVFEGQDITEMQLVESTDGSNLFRVEVVNNVSAMV